MKVTGFLVFGYRILGLRVLGKGFRFWVLCIFGCLGVWVFGFGFLGRFCGKKGFGFKGVRFCRVLV